MVTVQPVQGRGAVGFILATILIDAVGVGLIFPLLPDLMAHVGAAGTGQAAVLGAILLSAYAAMQFLFAPVIGGLSDAFGRKPLLLLALVALVIDYSVMALATSYGALLIARLVAGAAGATYTTATAYLADITPPDRRAGRFGLIGATFGLGFILGPVLGGLLAGWHLSAPFWAAAALAAGNVAFGLFVLPESLPPDRRRAFRASDLNPFAGLVSVFRLPGLALPLGLLFTFELANMVYPVLWSFWSRTAFGWSAAAIGMSFAFYGVGVVLAQGVLLGRLVARVGDWRTLMIAAGAAVVALIGFGVTPPVWLVLVLIPVACLSDMLPPTLVAMMSARVAEDRQGLLQGVIAAQAAVAAVLAPLVLSPLFEAFAEPAHGPARPGAPFLLAGLVMLAALPGFFALRRGLARG